MEAITIRVIRAFSQIKDTVVFTFNLPAIMELGAATGFDFELIDQASLGHEKLTQVYDQLLAETAKHPDMLVGVRPDGPEDVPQLEIDIDQEKAQMLGASINDINTILDAAWNGSYVDDLTDRGRAKKVYVTSEAKHRMLPDDIGDWYVRAADDQMVSFSAFSSPCWECGLPCLERYNSLSSMETLGQAVLDRSIDEAMKLAEQLASKLSTGVGCDWTGMPYQECLFDNQASPLYTISSIAVFLCLVALYEGWLISFSITLAVPPGVIGTLLVVIFRGLTSDVCFQVGPPTAIGLSARNAILVVEFTKDLVGKESKGLTGAMFDVVRMRLRPVLMTSLTFILDIMPLVISTGAGSNAQNVVGTDVIGGVVTITVLAIFFIPVFSMMVRRHPSYKNEDIEHGHIVDHH